MEGEYLGGSRVPHSWFAAPNKLVQVPGRVTQTHPQTWRGARPQYRPTYPQAQAHQVWPPPVLPLYPRVFWGLSQGSGERESGKHHWAAWDHGCWPVVGRQWRKRPHRLQSREEVYLEMWESQAGLGLASKEAIKGN